MANIKYAGIGSRETPADIIALMSLIGERLAIRGWTLRSGGADGADRAFELGCEKASGKKEIFLPWQNFNGSSSQFFTPSPEAHALASSHPVWNRLTDNVKLLHARNCHQVLGLDLNDPVSVLICWTKGGKIVGGTATAINLALKRNIPVLNLAISTDIKDAILKIDSGSI